MPSRRGRGSTGNASGPGASGDPAEAALEATKVRAARARAPAGQGLGGLWLLDGHEAFTLRALKNRARRRQQLPALAIVPAPARDRRLDNGD